MVDSKEQKNNSGNRRGLHPNSLKNLENGRKWRKGKSGNPGGRPPLAITSLLREMLDKEADIIPRGASPSDKTWRQLIAKAILIGCTKGNTSLIGELLDRLEGKISQPIETPTDKPLEVRVIEKVKDYGDNRG